MIILTVINQKGGVGKSTTAHALGAGLAIKGYKVLYIDLDGQGNLSYAMKANTAGYGSLGVLQRPETITSEIQHTEAGDVIASTPNLVIADSVIVDTGKEYRLKEALQAVSGLYDYCIVDTPPALSILTINALTASYGAIIPAQADIYSLQGIAQLNNTISAVTKYCNPGLKVLGVLLTRFNGRSVIRREVAELLESHAQGMNTKLFASRIRECTAIVEAQAVQEPIYKYAPKSNASRDYTAFVEELLTTLH